MRKSQGMIDYGMIFKCRGTYLGVSLFNHEGCDFCFFNNLCDEYLDKGQNITILLPCEDYRMVIKGNIFKEL